MTYMLCDSSPYRLPLLVTNTLTDVARYLDRPRKSVDISVLRWRAFRDSQLVLHRPVDMECPIRSHRYQLYYLVFIPD